MSVKCFSCTHLQEYEKHLQELYTDRLVKKKATLSYQTINQEKNIRIEFLIGMRQMGHLGDISRSTDMAQR